ncbi:carbon-nitrogen hydrolase family protein [Marinobacter gelidimuriae]|uniref:carbon-nitrogen hydrolase family protein n=1 Tax=Marinobacter gelidimuriae TaxID=2739064 RepID=UPI00035EC2FE|nr:carbon-nitrogen hydrolase family protein [Marinobacter gelidimuriae]
MTQQFPALVAALQMVSGHQLQDNLNAAAALLQQAAEAGVKVAVLPENFAVLASDQMLPCGKQEAGNQSVIRAFLAQQAKTLKLWIVGGSLPLALRPDGSVMADRVRASCLVFNDLGDEVARYDKIHLFDAQVDDAHGQYRESDTFEAGDQVVTVDTPAGRLGLAVCYDLRFPELFRALRDKGADWACLPSAFTWKTGNAHWHALIRARAIENQLYVVAAGQGGHNSSQRRTYGHSLICDPWGSVLAEVNEDGPGVATAALDKHWLDQLRQQMPVWSHRRL